MFVAVARMVAGGNIRAMSLPASAEVVDGVGDTILRSMSDACIAASNANKRCFWFCPSRQLRLISAFA